MELMDTGLEVGCVHECVLHWISSNSKIPGSHSHRAICGELVPKPHKDTRI